MTASIPQVFMVIYMADLSSDINTKSTLIEIRNLKGINIQIILNVTNEYLSKNFTAKLCKDNKNGVR